MKTAIGGALVATALVVAACEASMQVPASVAASSASGAGSASNGAKPEGKPAAPKPPPPLAAGQNKPYGIAVDGGFVYWANHGDHAIMKAPKNGGAPVKLGGVPGTLGPDLVAVDDQFVYVSAYDDHGSPDAPSSKILRVAKAGGPVSEVAGNTTMPMALVVDATHAYWLDDSTHTVMRAPKAGGAQQRLAQGYTSLESLAVDDSDVFFAGAKGNELPLMKVPKAGGNVTVLVPNTNTRAVVVDAQGVYFLKYAGADMALQRVPKAGGAPTVVGKVSDAMKLALVGGTVYGTHRGESDIWKLPTAGGASSVVVAIKPGGYGLAADDASVYWTDGVATVNKAPR